MENRKSKDKKKEKTRERFYSRLVDDTHDVQTGDDSGVLGRLALSVVEVRGNGDDGVGDLLAEVSLGRFLHLAQNHGRDFLGREGLHSLGSVHLDVRLAVLLDDLHSVKRQDGELADSEISAKTTWTEQRKDNDFPAS